MQQAGQRDGRELRPDQAEMAVESVSEDGDVVIRFFGGAAVVLHVSPEVGHFYRRLMVSTRDAG